MYWVLVSVLDVWNLQGTLEWEDVLLQLHKGGNKESRSKIRRIMVGTSKIVAGILLGDPTIAVAYSELFFELMGYWHGKFTVWCHLSDKLLFCFF